MKRQISATIIADSISQNGDRLTSFVLVFPRFILAELNTHRVFSRNSASSRAIPFNKMLESVQTDPFIPIAWMKDHSGMQGNEYFTDTLELHNQWYIARDLAIQQAKALSGLGLTKQIVNRLLEPFLWHTVIVTATEWENFFALRAHDAAEIHIQKLAYLMLDAYNASEPKTLDFGEWHIPFGDNIDGVRVQEELGNINSSHELGLAKAKIATARCARVSYTNFEGKDDYQADLELFNRLSSMGHWSPFEHCAYATERGYSVGGNFRGWTQMRHTMPNENKTDERIIKKYPTNAGN